MKYMLTAILICLGTSVVAEKMSIGDTVVAMFRDQYVAADAEYRVKCYTEENLLRRGMGYSPVEADCVIAQKSRTEALKLLFEAMKSNNAPINLLSA